MSRRKWVTAAAIAVAMWLCSVDVRADSVSIHGLDSQTGAEYSATMSYQLPIAPDTWGLLTIELTNLGPDPSVVGGQGRITSFGFGAPDGPSFTLEAGPSAAWKLTESAKITGWGLFDLVAYSGPNPNGGGPPGPGITFNQTGVFTLKVDPGAALNVQSFVTPNGKGAEFLARFQSVGTKDDSLEVPGTVTIVPLPPAAFAGAALFGGLGLYRRYRRRQIA